MDVADQGFPAAEVIWEVHCQLCPGMVDRVPQRDVESVGEQHVERVHPLADEGRHWEAWKASAVCDVCYAIIELPCWEHVSDPPTHAGNGRDETGEWLLCDTCHAYRVQGRRGPWVRYAYGSSIDRAPWVRTLSPDGQLAVRVELADTIRRLLLNLDQGRRLTL